MINIQTRELILKWKNKKKTQQQIADLVGCNQSAVSRLIAKYKKTGNVKNLHRTGRPTQLTRKTLAKLKTEFRKKAIDANKRFCSVDLKEFSQIIEKKLNKKYSVRHIQRILHRLDFSRITPRSQHIKNDSKKIAQFRRDLKKNFKMNTWVMNL